MTGDTSLRERKRDRTREEIRQAALELFDRQGFADTTIEQIADAADVGRRTFFRYFPTKQSVLFADAEAKGAALAEAYAAQPADVDPVTAAVAAIDELIDVMEPQRGRHELFRGLLAEQAEAVGAKHLEVAERVRRALAGAIAERMGVDELTDPRPTAWAFGIVGCFAAAHERWLAATDDRPPSLHTLFRDALAACGNGFPRS
jgi:AcrR family transcriptional regulator